VLRRAAAGLNDPKYTDIAQQIGGGTSRLQLTLHDVVDGCYESAAVESA
jgi:hypothetical protein